MGSTFAKYSVRIGAFILTLLIGLSSVPRVEKTNEFLQPPNTIKQYETSSSSVIDSPISHRTCLEKDIYRGRGRQIANEIPKVEDRLQTMETKLAKLQEKWPMPERPAQPDDAALLAYLKAIDTMPAKKINSIKVKILELSVRLDALRDEADRHPEDLLYRCAEF